MSIITIYKPGLRRGKPTDRWIMIGQTNDGQGWYYWADSVQQLIDLLPNGATVEVRP